MLLLTRTGFGQGWANFFNNPNTLIKGLDGAPITGTETYYFALLTAPMGTTDPHLFTFTQCYATNMAEPGRINGGWGAFMSGWAPGVAQAFLVCGWPAYLGHDWNANRMNGGTPFGLSKIATGIAGGGGPFPKPPLNLFGSDTIDSGFMISGCPTPFWDEFTRTPTNQTVIAGEATFFDVTAVACPLPFYQWYLNGEPIPGATDNSFQVTNASAATAGTYSVTAWNTNWPSCCETQNASATLTVLILPDISSPPQSQTAVVGSTVHFQVGAFGPPPLSFQWFFNGGAAVIANGADLWLTNVQVSDSGPYTAVISNPYGSITSSPALLTVLAQPPKFTLSPWTRTALLGGFVDFPTKADGALPLSYQWSFNGQAIVGQTNPVLHLKGLGFGQAGEYSVTVTNLFGTSSSAPAILTVNPVPDYPTGTILGWGATNSLPEVWTNVIAISAGGDHDLALRKDGTVVAWGQNSFGQCSVPDDVTNVIQVAAGGSHSLALRADGSVAAWGWDDRRQTNIPPGLSNVVAIAASGMRSLALTSDGSVIIWGTNFVGESTVPTNLDGVVAIAAGVYHTLALRFDGQVIAWGYNASGQCSVPSTLSNVMAIAAGGNNSLALRFDGSVVGWGGIGGQTAVPPGLNGVVEIAAGADMFNVDISQGLALKTDGTVVAWGDNSNGQTSLPTNLSHVIAVSSGAYHSLALLAPSPIIPPQGAPNVTQPVSRVAEIGSPVTFSVRASGDPPLHFQWFFDYSNSIPDATSTTLKIAAAQLDQVGTYTVVVTNALGAVTSTPAQLNLVAPLKRRIVSTMLLTGQAGAIVQVDFSDQIDFTKGWTRLTTFTLTNDSQIYVDPTEPLPPQRFYHISQPRSAAGPPRASLSMIPALLLTGTIGSSMRIDYINQFGPTQAWLILGTITLTNNSQLFLDTSSIGQPPRLWRIVPVP